MHQALSIHNLIAGYGQRVLLRNLCFTVSGPAFVAIIGHNGCGKTTLFRALTGQIPYQGQVQVLGRELRAQRRPAASGLLAHLPQRASVEFSIPVRELVVMGRFRHHRFLGGYTAQDYALADAALVQVGAAHLAQQDFMLLSGGEQQLVWLAQLSLQDAQLYLLDEPTQQLDVYYRRRVFALLESWVQAHNKTILCITHDLENLAELPGYLLNLSRPVPALLPLSAATVQTERAFLESEESLHVVKWGDDVMRQGSTCAN
ncbi:ABC transporter ATP-binding protein [Hymenobacter endophyticus]|uniref:ABC transporter ATP-binding protein n=1 Tax=Hymenobacter endophyticus TaxID=3076335 RepID=A0ABU3TH81_9BACT|nr:ABC transporter ATP-binding protein [Hymenobacter endophyticus]MDU0370722.1 ABC transporter ATP-binding protein [Hymenobacter endophyticus]